MLLKNYPSALYVRMPRCASTSLRLFCIKNNISYFGGHNMGFWRGHGSGKAIVKRNTSDHLYQCILNHIGSDAYKKSYKFTSARNPYSRAVSMYKHQSWNSAKTFKDFCCAIHNNDFPHQFAKWHSTTLTEHLLSDGKLQVDAVIKLETMQKDLDMVCDEIGISRQPIPHRNKSKHRPYTDYYDDETRQIVAKKYAKDIEYFGYEFGE